MTEWGGNSTKKSPKYENSRNSLGIKDLGLRAPPAPKSLVLSDLLHYIRNSKYLTKQGHVVGPDENLAHIIALRPFPKGNSLGNLTGFHLLPREKTPLDNKGSIGKISDNLLEGLQFLLVLS